MKYENRVDAVEVIGDLNNDPELSNKYFLASDFRAVLEQDKKRLTYAYLIGLPTGVDVLIEEDAPNLRDDPVPKSRIAIGQLLHSPIIAIGETDISIEVDYNPLEYDTIAPQAYKMLQRRDESRRKMYNRLTEIGMKVLKKRGLTDLVDFLT